MLKSVIVKHLNEVAFINELDESHDTYKDYVAYVLRNGMFGLPYWKFVFVTYVVNHEYITEAFMKAGLSKDKYRECILQLLGIIVCVNPNAYDKEKCWDFTIDSPILLDAGSSF